MTNDGYSLLVLVVNFFPLPLIHAVRALLNSASRAMPSVSAWWLQGNTAILWACVTAES